MHRRLWNMDHASFFSEATLIEIGVYTVLWGIDLFTVYDAILAGGQNTAKITVNVWDFGPLELL